MHLALGKSEDGTEDSLANFDFKIIPTLWDDKLKEGAIILSQQTNVALDDLKKSYNEDDDWGIYLQCDEVFHEDDYELIKEDIKKAQESGCDVMTFRYLHFWQSHHKIAINKKWYPQEIRAVKLKTPIESWGDAQSFKNYTKAYHSEARIFHYGHVREEEKYKSKKWDIMTLYHAKDKINKYRRKEKKFDQQTVTLDYYGPHPKVMKERIEKLGDKFYHDTADEVWIVGNQEKYQDCETTILANKIHWIKKRSSAPREKRSQAVIMNPSFFDRIFHSSQVPKQPHSKLSRPWNEDFLLTLKLSEKGIGRK